MIEFEQRLHQCVHSYLDVCVAVFGGTKAQHAMDRMEDMWRALGQEGLQPPGWNFQMFQLVVCRAKSKAMLEELRNML